MHKLTDSQLVILSAAANRDDRSILPFPPSLSLNNGALAAVLKSLLGKGLISKCEAAPDGETWRRTEDETRLKLMITDAGLEAIGIDPRDGEMEHKPDHTPMRPAPAESAAARRSSKSGQVVALLRRPEGASIADLQQATAWQAHSVRGFLSGTVKKKLGLPLVANKSGDGIRRYHVMENKAEAAR